MCYHLKTRTRLAGISVCMAVCAMTATAQDAVVLRESWTGVGMGGWTNTTGKASLSQQGSLAVMTFPTQDAPAAAWDVLRLPLGSGIRPTNVTVRFAPMARPPSSARVYFHGRSSGRSWYRILADVAAGGDHSVPVDEPGAWVAGPVHGAAAFQEDVLDVAWVGIYMRRDGSGWEQSVGVDSVGVDGYGIDTDGDGIPDPWERVYNLADDDPIDRTLDSDGDGMSNYAEYRAGTNPREIASRFALHIHMAVAGSDSGVEIEWPSATNRTYTVRRAAAPGGLYDLLKSGVPSDPPRTTYTDREATGPGPFYYRIEVEP